MHPLLKPKTISMREVIVTLIGFAIAAPMIAKLSFFIASPFTGWTP